MRLGEEFDAVDVIEAAGAFTGHLHILFLVFAHGHPFGAVLKDIGCHQGRVGKQSRVDVIGLLSGFFLEGGDAAEFADIGVHVEIEVEFDGFWHIALDIDGGLFGVDAAGQVFGEYGTGGPLDVFRFGVGGQRVPVGDEEVAVVFFLHFHEATDSAVVVAEMEVTGGADAAEDDVFHKK